jgi:hypothetical protein
MWFSLFNDEAQQLFGKSADDANKLSKTDPAVCVSGVVKRCSHAQQQQQQQQRT